MFFSSALLLLVDRPFRALGIAIGCSELVKCLFRLHLECIIIIEETYYVPNECIG